MLTTVNQRVAKARQVHAHHVHMQRALRLLAGVRCSKVYSGQIRHRGREAEPNLGAALRTYALWLRSAPGQVGLTGPGGGALDQVTWLALKGHDAAHLWQEEDSRQRSQKGKIKCQSKLCFKGCQAKESAATATQGSKRQEDGAWRQKAVKKWQEDACRLFAMLL